MSHSFGRRNSCFGCALTRCMIGLALLATPLLAQSQEPAQFTAEDMLDVVTVNGNSIRLSPEGERVAFVYPDVEDETNVMSRRPTGYVQVMRLRGNGSDDEKVVTRPGRGSAHTSFPAWSPDGRQLAYFVEADNGHRLVTWNAETGEVCPVGRVFAGAPYLAPQWSSTGEHIVYARAMEKPEKYETLFPPPPTFARAVRGRDKDDMPRVVVVDSDDQRIPGDLPFLDRRKAVLSVATLASGEESVLTDEPVYLRHFQVSPNETQVIYTAATEESLGLAGGEVSATYLVSLDGREPPRLVLRNGKQIRWGPSGDNLFYLKDDTVYVMGPADDKARPYKETEELSVNAFVWSDDGNWLAMLVPDVSLIDSELEPNSERMYSIARPFNDLYLLSAETGRSHNVPLDSTDQIHDPTWSSDSESIFFRTVDNDTYEEYLYKYDVENSRLRALTGGAKSFNELRAQGDLLLFTAQNAQHPPDVFAISTDSGSRRRITDLNPHLSVFEFSEPNLFQFVNGDGERLSAALYRPVNVEPSAKVPVITYVYEKLTRGIHHFSARHQIFLNHGFAVLMPNVKVQVGETGTSFVKSVVPATAAVRSMGFTNGKFGIWGGSFGAYATAFIITQTDMFACAVARATPPDLFSNWASGRDRDSQNIERGQARMGGSPYEVMERYLAQSALFHLDKVDTPILIMHGAQDTTILFHEGAMMFYALRQLGKEAKFVAYTYGDHSLYRHSRADAIDVYERLLNWFNRYLK